MEIQVASVKTEDGYELRRVSEGAIDPVPFGWIVQKQTCRSTMTGKDGVEMLQADLYEFNPKTGTLLERR